VNVDPFEFLIGLYTIIVGLGISLLVRSIGQMIEGRSRIRLYWVHTAWLALIFMAHVSSWFVLWQYHEVESWSVLECMMLLCVPILLYLVSHLAVPEIDETCGLSITAPIASSRGCLPSPCSCTLSMTR